MYPHENNIKSKMDNIKFVDLYEELDDLYNAKYLPMRSAVEALDFINDKNSFEKATKIFNEYYDILCDFTRSYEIKSQAKIESSYLEEISTYLFQKLPQIQNNELGIYNKKIFAGLKIKDGTKIDVITKDVDFCIGREIKVSIDNGKPQQLVIPVVAVEVKTFLDATMFGEVKSSSKAIRNATPNAHTYVLMGYRDLKDVHITAARNDAALNEMFALRKNKNSPMEASVFEDYFNEIVLAVNSISTDNSVPKWGRLLNG